MRRLCVTGRPGSGKTAFISLFLNGGELQQAVFNVFDGRIQLDKIRYMAYSGGQGTLKGRVVIQLASSEGEVLESITLAEVSKDTWQASDDDGKSLGIITLNSLDSLVKERIVVKKASHLTIYMPMSDYAREVFGCRLLEIVESELETVEEYSKNCDYLFVLNSVESLLAERLAIDLPNLYAPVIAVFIDKSLTEPPKYSHKKIYSAIQTRGLTISTPVTNSMSTLINIPNLNVACMKVPKKLLVNTINSLPTNYSANAISSMSVVISKRINRNSMKDLAYFEDTPSAERLADDLNRLLEGVTKEELSAIIQEAENYVANVVKQEVEDSLPYNTHLVESIYLVSKSKSISLVGCGEWEALEANAKFYELISLSLLCHIKGVKSLLNNKSDVTMEQLEDRLPNLFNLVDEYTVCREDADSEDIRAAYNSAINSVLNRGYYPSGDSLASLIRFLYATKLSVIIKP